jgi:hypothetical protein
MRLRMGAPDGRFGTEEVLVAAALDEGGPDNVTCVAFRLV